MGMGVICTCIRIHSYFLHSPIIGTTGIETESKK
jgi:hypothetical protein